MTRKKILIVDDEPHVIRVLRLTLEREGYGVDSAANGSDALERISMQMPDLMITDVQMPHVGGRQLCETVRCQFPDNDFPILVMSSMTDLDGRNWVQGLKRIEFLEKPLSPRNLVTRLCALFAEAPTGVEHGHA